MEKWPIICLLLARPTLDIGYLFKTYVVRTSVHYLCVLYIVYAGWPLVFGESASNRPEDTTEFRARASTEGHMTIRSGTAVSRYLPTLSARGSICSYLKK